MGGRENFDGCSVRIGLEPIKLVTNFEFRGHASHQGVIGFGNRHFKLI